MDKDGIYKQHIVDAIADIESYVADMTQERFETNKLTQDAVIRKFQVIGEAAKRLSPKFKNNRAGIPWKKISGMRDILIHDYFQVDLSLVWNTIKKELPVLKLKLK